MVTTVSRAWSRSGDHRTVEQAHADLVEQLERAGGRGIYPVSEAAVDAMRQEAARLSKPVPWDAARAEAGRELSTVTRRYWQAYTDVLDYQEKLARPASSGEHAILRDVPQVAPPEPPQRMLDRLFPAPQRRSHPDQWGLITPEFDTATGYYEAAQAVMARVLDLEATRARLRAVFAFETFPVDQQNRRLILALARNVASDVAELRNRIGALEDRIAELERPTISKRGKAR